MNLYLSRIKLNPSSRQVIKELSQPYEMHRTLMRAFPAVAEGFETKARNEYGMLFRAENTDCRNPIKLYVQSLLEPDWRFLDGLSDYLCQPSGVVSYNHKDVMPLYQRIQEGQVFSFRLRANPTRRIGKGNDTMKGKRVELRREEDQVDWLTRKGTRGGGFELVVNEAFRAGNDDLSLPQVRVSSEGKLWGRKGGSSNGHTMTHYAVLFEGLLRVTNHHAFIETLASGVGSAKAFGFGLLSIAPVRQPIKM
ncbi:MAG: type I-E CRISPR-associated protein Cas6/Cse3/CasE [Chlorobium sp.]|nr:type I-E CRISPR-associated protein Cas6/Cse3/CasE [Chlorobium sp.]